MSLLAGTRPHAIPLAGVSWCRQQATILHIRAYEARALPIELWRHMIPASQPVVAPIYGTARVRWGRVPEKEGLYPSRATDTDRIFFG